MRILKGTSDAGIRFHDLCTLLRRLGFTERVKGSHRIFTRDGMAKPYRVKQVRRVLVQYRLAEERQ